jgi:hypothetical protein
MADTIVKNVYQRMIEVQKKVSSVQKTDTVKMFEGDKGYKAVTHDEVAALLHKPLAEEGIVLLPDVIESSTSEIEIMNKYKELKRWYRTDLKIKVKWINADNPSDFFESIGGAFALDQSDKSYAKAYSLALKIVLLKVHLLESRDGEEQRPFDNENESEPKSKSKNQPVNNQNNKPASQPSSAKIADSAPKADPKKAVDPKKKSQK